MNNNGPYQPSIVMSTNQFEEFAALKAENKRLVESNKKENANFYSAGLMCERILAKEEIEKLKAENARQANANIELHLKIVNLTKEKCAFEAENENLAEAYQSMGALFHQAEEDKAELLDALQGIIYDSRKMKSDEAYYEIKQLLSKHEAK